MRKLPISPLLAATLAATLAIAAMLPGTLLAAPAAGGPDSEQARFARCGGGGRVTCVVDGDTIWYRGVKIRIADINAPELSEPRCAAEAKLAVAATERLTTLLNQGPFTLVADRREYDRYGRTLRVVTRRGRSLGAVLTGEGLAEPWRGYRRTWC